ncbi:hypothetical protein TIFTF001_013910 [Ficus carica]|uniref:Uncharacterized protein n=1 Tax=Ficus carica TaxID=3494 RepID=A0AA87ZYL5_FICCA|nr:hypothetical protein TIFTF001_013910 [Ficus carica]
MKKKHSDFSPMIDFTKPLTVLPPLFVNPSLEMVVYTPNLGVSRSQPVASPPCSPIPKDANLVVPFQVNPPSPTMSDHMEIVQPSSQNSGDTVPIKVETSTHTLLVNLSPERVGSPSVNQGDTEVVLVDEDFIGPEFEEGASIPTIVPAVEDPVPIYIPSSVLIADHRLSLKSINKVPLFRRCMSLMKMSWNHFLNPHAKVVSVVQSEKSNVESEPEPVTNPALEQASVPNPVPEVESESVPATDLISAPTLKPAHETSVPAETPKQKGKYASKTSASRKTSNLIEKESQL